MTPEIKSDRALGEVSDRSIKKICSPNSSLDNKSLSSVDGVRYA